MRLNLCAYIAAAMAAVLSGLGADGTRIETDCATVTTRRTARSKLQYADIRGMTGRGAELNEVLCNKDAARRYAALLAANKLSRNAGAAPWSKQLGPVDRVKVHRGPSAGLSAERPGTELDPATASDPSGRTPPFTFQTQRIKSKAPEEMQVDHTGEANPAAP